MKYEKASACPIATLTALQAICSDISEVILKENALIITSSTELTSEQQAAILAVPMFRLTVCEE